VTQSTALVPTGIVTWCCDFHQPTNCCDPTDCGPCCPECPTCPIVATWPPDIRRTEARAMRDLIIEAQHTYRASRNAIERLHQQLAEIDGAVARGSDTPVYDATVAALYGRQNSNVAVDNGASP
jgi:hypothetical protein